MTLEKLMEMLTESIKSKNKVKKAVIADVVTCTKNMAIEKKTKDNITEDIVDAAILKCKKTCQEQIDTCPKNRTDLFEFYNENMKYINEIAPAQMSEKEICNFVYTKFMELQSINKPINKGLLMKAVMPELKGKTDGKLVNKVVMEILADA